MEESQATGIVIDNPDSILQTVKKAIGLLPDDETFDIDMIMHINMTFAVLNQMGVGPTRPFEITGDSEKWEDFIGDNRLLNMVKSYMYKKVQKVFDTPTQGPLSNAMDSVIQELEWRLSIAGEEGKLIDGL